jgi:hypothetical protein
VFVNAEDYKNGRITKELLLHEFAHITQRHSLDIIFVELLQIMFWFNPLILLYKKAIRLNHEYLADSAVLNADIDLSGYQKLLLNFVFRNNSIYLASSFNYSLTKKRLLMMTKNNSSKMAMLKKIAVIPLFLTIGLLVINAQDPPPPPLPPPPPPPPSVNVDADQWWKTILQRHNVVPSAYNNLPNVFEMGEKNSIENGVATLEKAYVLVNNKDEYMIIESPLVYHEIKANIIKAKEGTLKKYRKDSKTLEPYTSLQFKELVLEVDE